VRQMAWLPVANSMARLTHGAKTCGGGPYDTHPCQAASLIGWQLDSCLHAMALLCSLQACSPQLWARTTWRLSSIAMAIAMARFATVW